MKSCRQDCPELSEKTLAPRTLGLLSDVAALHGRAAHGRGSEVLHCAPRLGKPERKRHRTADIVLVVLLIM
jgi:hypothetical protein